MSNEDRHDYGSAAPASHAEPTLRAVSLYPEDWALFLDLDGTLIAHAEKREAVTVPPNLPFDLDALARRLDGAIALVTDRAVDSVDRLLFPHRFPIAGLHGAERRSSSGSTRRMSVSPAFNDIKQAIIRDAKVLSNVLIEDKGAVIAAHFQLAPEHQWAVQEMMQRYVAFAGPDWTLQRGKMVVEIRPVTASKGKALESFLNESPFKGRRPIAIGDDLTDETMFVAANRLGGHSIRIGQPDARSAARSFIPSSGALRSLISRLADRSVSASGAYS
ncbi:trehalose-phosphatase [Rhizobium binxianense]